MTLPPPAEVPEAYADRISEVLIGEKEIAQTVARMGEEVSRDYAGEALVAVSVLKGSTIFAADLIRRITVPVQLEFMGESKYGPHSPTGVVRITKDLDIPIEGEHILLIECLIDTGFSLNYLYRNLELREPKSIKICTFLDKPHRRKVDLTPDWVGFEVPDQHVVGYGLDYQGKYRNLPYLGFVE
ncbi:MAG: hypoxanthine phosphoribosyltransferase [Nitrospinae bacterium]|nr:hypoxanthine phosphoribosyltransferase [Nitrospinota bacterium]